MWTVFACTFMGAEVIRNVKLHTNVHLSHVGGRESDGGKVNEGFGNHDGDLSDGAGVSGGDR